MLSMSEPLKGKTSLPVVRCPAPVAPADFIAGAASAIGGSKS